MPVMQQTLADRPIYRVSELAGAARLLLEERFALIWVEGEISNLRMPSSGHWYFTLKDDKAQLRCAMFANRNRALRFKPRDGMQVILRGRVSLYEPRGDFQLLADHLEAAGEGALRAAFDALKVKLAAEGLFASERKVSLPAYPNHIAVVSSRTGAALRDILAVLRRRCPTVRVTLLNVAVQGNEAEPQLLDAFTRLSHWPEALGTAPDVVLLARGGGSLEDLWSFNLETVARAIAACPLPVVSAVGHETDITISDFTADLRAPTPSAGAELIAPDMQTWEIRARSLARSLYAHWRQSQAQRAQSVRQIRLRLIHPGRALQLRMQRLDELERQLTRSVRTSLAHRRANVGVIAARMQQFHPQRDVALARRTLEQLRTALTRAIGRHLERATLAAAGVGRALHAVSPLETLGRGFSIITTPAPASSRWGTPITSILQAAPGQGIVAHLDDGTLECNVEGVTPNATA